MAAAQSLIPSNNSSYGSSVPNKRQALELSAPQSSCVAYVLQGGVTATAAVDVKHEISGTLTDLGDLYTATLTEVGRAEETRLLLPRVSLQEVDHEAATSPICAILHNRDLGKIGSWAHASGLWTMHLLIAGRRRTPFAPIDKHRSSDLVLVVQGAIPTSRREDVQMKTDVEVSIRESDVVRTVKGFQPNTEVLGRVEGKIFDQDNQIQTYTLDIDLWRRTLRRWAVSWANKDCTIHFNVSSSVLVTRRRDLSNVGQILLSHSELCDEIAQWLSLRDIQSLRGTCHTIANSLSTVLERRLRVAFSPYFRDIPGFCTALKASHAVVSGSMVLSILRPGNWKPGDIDIVVHDRYVQILKAYLKEQGFDISSDVVHGNLEYPGIINPWHRVEFDYYCYTKDSLKVDLCVMKNNMTPADYVMTYHCTAVMNLFDGQHIFCFFPDETFNGRYMRNHFTPTARVERGLEKYRSRGYAESSTAEGQPIYIQDKLPHEEHGAIHTEHLPSIWALKANFI